LSADVSHKVRNISTVAAEAAQEVSQMARAATELNDLTGHLQDLIAKFKMDTPVLHAYEVAVPSHV
jgi:methyl-accepting chemotaxis protein